MTGPRNDGTGDESLAQIVAALSVTYRPEGVLTWLTATRMDSGLSARSMIGDGEIAEVAEAVRRIGDADPSDFTVTEARQ